MQGEYPMNPELIAHRDQLGKARMLCKMRLAKWSFKQISQATGITPGGAHTIIRTELGSAPKVYRGKPVVHAPDPRKARNQELAPAFGRLIEQGWSYREIGSSVGISYERVRQIVSALPERPTKPTKDRYRAPLSPEEAFERWRNKQKARILQCKADGCWEWDGYKWAPNPKYPEYRVAKYNAQYKQHSYDVAFHYAYRLSYWLFKGDIAPDMTVDHLCHNPLCVNPDHLELKTLSANSANKGPSWRDKQRALYEKKRADNKPRNQEILERKARGEKRRDIAAAMGIKPSMVDNVLYHYGKRNPGVAA